ncbi:hypothetical protein ACLKA7_008417 [Drosophila subpalustris]
MSTWRIGGLDLLTDGFLLLKVGRRLELANVSMDHKHPILLPSNDDFVRHYVQFLHRHHYHAGPKALVALLRLQFWIVNARDLARTVVRGCVHCVRYKPKLQQQLMGNLPVERLTPSRPFAHCGVDFCGPWTKSTPSISNGDMVLIHEDNVPSQKWIMGRITATVPGRDQRVRVLDVRTNKGIIRYHSETNS